MGACRETANLWQYVKWLLGPSNGMRRMAWEGLKKGMPFKSPFFVHDTFGRYLNRFVVCPLIGHGKVQNIEDDYGNEQPYCFKCEQFLTQHKAANR